MTQALLWHKQVRFTLCDLFYWGRWAWAASLRPGTWPAHDGGPHVPVGLLVGDEVNGCLAGRVPQHGVPGGPRQRDVFPVALHHVRQGQDVGVEVAVVELTEGLPPMTLAVFTASRWSSTLTAFPASTLS